MHSKLSWKRTLKTLSRSKKNKIGKRSWQKSQEPLNPRRARSPHSRANQHGQTLLSGTVVPPSMARPWPCQISGLPSWFSLCTPVARPCLTLFSSALLFLVLGASSNLYPSPESSWMLSFPSKVKGYPWKAQISRNISIITSKEADISLSYLD